jgi:prophage antirepressor-like protein
MNNQIQVFNNPEFGTVRTICEDDKVLFCGSDVAKALGYQNPSRDVNRHCKAIIERCTTDSVGRQQSMLFIPESDVYRLVFGSKLPTAEKFTDWVTEEVLPSIRKHGAYMTQEKLQEVLCNPDALFQIVSALKEESDKRKALEIQNSALAVDLAIAQPKADYFDDCMARGGLMNFRDTAKLLGMRQKEFIDNLLRDSYLYRDKRGRLLPYQKRNNGYLEIKEAFNNSSDWNGVQTLVTPKGREFFRSLYPSV